MENQEINDRLAAIESEIKAIPKIQADVVAIQADIVALQAELKVLGARMSHVEGSISELGQGQKRMEQAIAEYPLARTILRCVRCSPEPPGVPG